MMLIIVSLVTFCSPRLMREIDTPLSFGLHMSPNAPAVGDPGRRRY